MPATPTNGVRTKLKHLGVLGQDTFEQDTIEDFNLIEAVTLGFEEFSALVDRCFYDRTVVFSEGCVRAIRLEQILATMKGLGQAL